MGEFTKYRRSQIAELRPWQPGEYCDRCNNTGEIDCHCGGDLCVCGAQEIECPRCHGLSGRDFVPGLDDDEDDYP